MSLTQRVAPKKILPKKTTSFQSENYKKNVQTKRPAHLKYNNINFFKRANH